MKNQPKTEEPTLEETQTAEREALIKAEEARETAHRKNREAAKPKKAPAQR